MDLKTVSVMCPYCGESIDITVEPLGETQSMIEDCSVCCRPIQLDVTPGEEGPEVLASRSS